MKIDIAIASVPMYLRFYKKKCITWLLLLKYKPIGSTTSILLLLKKSLQSLGKPLLNPLEKTRKLSAAYCANCGSFFEMSALLPSC